ncbi:MAG: hypothetical protein AAGK47_04100, partial [Bacteroidota bacterium]
NYISFNNDPNISSPNVQDPTQAKTDKERNQIYLGNGKALTPFYYDLIFGMGTIILEASKNPNELRGSIGDPQRQGWELQLTGSYNYGDPFTARFQGKGTVSGNEWIYEYVGYMINPWQNGVDQVPAFVGSVIRQIDHPSSDGTIHKAGVVASFYAVKKS